MRRLVSYLKYKVLVKYAKTNETLWLFQEINLAGFVLISGDLCISLIPMYCDVLFPSLDSSNVPSPQDYTTVSTYNYKISTALSHITLYYWNMYCTRVSFYKYQNIFSVHGHAIPLLQCKTERKLSQNIFVGLSDIWSLFSLNHKM
jgi:hypothetical protein